MSLPAQQQLKRAPWTTWATRCAWPLAALLFLCTLAGVWWAILGALQLAALLAVLPAALALVWRKPGVLRWAWLALTLAVLVRIGSIVYALALPRVPYVGAIFDALGTLLLLIGAALLMCLDRFWHMEALQHILEGLLLGFVLGAALLVIWHIDMQYSPPLTLLIVLHVAVAMRFLVNFQHARRIAGAAFLLFIISELLHLEPLHIDLTGGLLGAAHLGVAALVEVLAWAFLITIADLAAPLKPVRDPSAASADASAWSHGVAFAIIVSAALASVPPIILLGLAVTYVGREMVLDRRRRYAWREINVEFQDERGTWSKQQEVFESTIDMVRRGAHDMAPFVQELWRIQSGIEEKAPELGNSMYDQLKPLARLTGQTLSHAAGQPLELHRESVDLHALVESALDAAEERALVQDVDMRTLFATTITRIVSDATALRRILDNLLTNALDVLPAGGRILIELAEDRSSEHMLILSVRDNGPGLTPEQQKVIFEDGRRFRSGKGYGIGLANVKQLSEALGGTCGVSSEPGSGTTIWVQIPEFGLTEGVNNDARPHH